MAQHKTSTIVAGLLIDSKWCDLEHEAVVADADGLVVTKVGQTHAIGRTPRTENLKHKITIIILMFISNLKQMLKITS